MRISDEMLEYLGDYYTSDFVAKVKPWMRKLDFYEWVELYLNGTFTITKHGKV